MNINRSLLFVGLIAFTLNTGLQAISRGAAVAATVTFAAGSFAGLTLIQPDHYRRNPTYKTNGVISAGIALIAGLIFYQYTPGPRYRSVKWLLKSIETNPLAAMRMTRENFEEILEVSNCFNDALCIPLVKASKQLDAFGALLQFAEEQLTIAHDDEPEETSLKMKIIALISAVDVMKKNISANNRFIKNLPAWRESLSVYAQQMTVENQTSIAHSSQIQANAANRNSWTLMFLTIAEWIKAFRK